MDKFNFDNKRFTLIRNSELGNADTQTIFEYKQENDLVTADYYGGFIKYGKIIAHLKEDKLFMLYQCITINNELKAGKAIANISLTENNKIKLKLNWEWLDESEKGVSEYIED